MKNRTIIGIVCMILAVAMTFAVAPLVNRLTSDTTTVVRLKQEVGRGAKITAEQVETVKVKTDTMPQGVYVNTADVIGKYASSTLNITVAVPFRPCSMQKRKTKRSLIFQTNNGRFASLLLH